MHAPSFKPSAGNFGQDLHTPDKGRNPKIAAILAVLDPHHRGPAAHPALLPAGEFRRQNQDHLEFASRAYLGVGIEKYPARAQVAGVAGGLNLPLLRLDRNRQAHREAPSAAAFALRFRHEEGESTTSAIRRWLIFDRRLVQDRLATGTATLVRPAPKTGYPSGFPMLQLGAWQAVVPLAAAILGSP
jgi:hypothetical protein